MRITKKQLRDILKQNLTEVGYYTKKLTYGDEEAAEKFELDFDKNSSLEWAGKHDPENNLVELRTKAEFTVTVRIYEPKGSKYSVEVSTGHKDDVVERADDLSPRELAAWIEGVDEVVLKAIGKRVREGVR